MADDGRVAAVQKAQDYADVEAAMVQSFFASAGYQALAQDGKWPTRALNC